MPSYEIRSILRQDTAVVALTSPLDSISESMGRAFEKTFHALGAAGMEPAGPPVARYFNMDEPFEYEAGVAVATPFAGSDEVKPGEIGGVEAAVGIHIGPYDTLEQTYTAMMEWIRGQGRTVAGPMWETYLTDPNAEPDPQAWRTEVFIPVA